MGGVFLADPAGLRVVTGSLQEKDGGREVTEGAEAGLPAAGCRAEGAVRPAAHMQVERVVPGSF